MRRSLSFAATLTALATLSALVGCSDGPAQTSGDTEPLGPSNGSGGDGAQGQEPGPSTPGAPVNPGPGNVPASGGDGPGPVSNVPGTPGSTPPGVNPTPTAAGSVPGTPVPGPGGEVPGPGEVPVSGGSGPGPVVDVPGVGGNPTPGAGGSAPTSGGSGPVVVGNGGAINPGGAPGAGGSGPDLDQSGKANALPGEMTSQAQDYLRLGEVRILNNNWGSAELGCNAPMSVFVNQDRSFGWSFNRGDCDTAASNQKPDFPQVEFGIHPFGIGDELVTSPEFSSTTLLPLQIKDIQSASVNVQNLTANLQRESSWNITFEFWLSERHPVNDPNPGVYAELMTFWGWQDGRWPAPPNGTGPTGNGAGAQVSSGGKSYTLWVQDDAWANAQWRYFQFRADDGPQKSFNGTLDVKPFLDYLVNSRQYSGDLWVTRLEVGSEIDDETQGTVQMSGITFEVNGQTRAAIVGGN